MVNFLKEKSSNFTKLDFDIEDLKKNKFGYRAKYIIDAAAKIKQTNLRMINDRKKIVKFLMSIKGIGRKVCDCILLMGYGYYDVVPLDVHMIKMSKKLFGINEKKGNDEVNDLYKEMFGDYCGIAQLYLFKYSIDQKEGMSNEKKN